MGNRFKPRSVELMTMMREAGVGVPFVVELEEDEREDNGYIKFRQRVKNCAERLEEPQRVSVNRLPDWRVAITLLGAR